MYANLAWLAAEQAHIEQRLQRRTPPAPFPGVVLYDVTSSYLEGRGMITHAHKEDLAAHGMRYVKALTMPQIEHLLREQRLLEKAKVKLPQRLAPVRRPVHTKTRLRRKLVSC